MPDPTQALKQRLATLRQTVRFLLEKAAAAGGEVRLDLIDRHSLLQTRADIAQCKADLRAQGVIVDDMPEDTATVAVVAGTEPGAGRVNVVAQTIGTIVGGDKVQGDKVQGDKHEHHHHYPASQPTPPMPLDQALALLASLPAGPDDPIPPPTTFQTSDVPRLMPLTPNDLFVGRDAALRDVAGRLKAGEGVVI
ncbi:MAG TPA: hypothetical protein VFS21_15705, partial [Roseiflexaceae bacterium]|nr:hypothetical protein [Roseiflexaceae bacterium]